jgi:hypothetical protein
MRGRRAAASTTVFLVKPEEQEEWTGVEEGFEEEARAIHQAAISVRTAREGDRGDWGWVVGGAVGA